MAADWIECTLGDVIELKRGYDLPRGARKPGVVPLVSSSGVSDHQGEVMVRGPGVVTGRYGTLGQVFFIEQDFWPLNTTLYVHDFKGNDPRFISYFLRSLDLGGYSDKAAVPGVNRNHLHREPVRVPSSKAEQRRIANILGTLDDKIELNRRMNETLEEMARALFKSWFVDFEPVRAKADGRDPGLPAHVADLFPDRLVDSALGEIPEGWAVKSIGDLAEIVGGGTPSTKEPAYWDDGAHYWATPKDLSRLDVPVLLETGRRITDAGLAKIGSGLLPVGTVLLSSRAPIGYLAVAEVPVAVNQGFIAMKPKESVPSSFLLRWAEAASEVIVARANGSTFLEISKSNFRPIPVAVPPVPLLEVSGKLLESLHRRVVSNSRESRSLIALRDRLLPELLDGTLNVEAA